MSKNSILGRNQHVSSRISEGSWNTTSNVNEKFLRPMIETTQQMSELSQAQRIELYKIQHGLTHGKGKRKKNKSKKKRR